MPAECLPVPDSILKAGLPVAKRRRNIGEPEVLAMAELMVMRLTDVEACKVANIHYKSWVNWKCRNQEKLGEILSRTMGATIRENFECIKAARSKDWRAARELLSLHAPERFNDRLNSAPTVQVNVVAGQALAKITGGVWSEQKPRSIQAESSPTHIGATAEPKQLQDKAKPNPS